MVIENATLRKARPIVNLTEEQRKILRLPRRRMKDYVELALRTESTIFSISEQRQRLLHAAIGLSTEAGELLDALKKAIYYSRELDTQNLREEMGDLFWYLAILSDELGYSFEQCQEDNIKKLMKRYPEGFSDVVIRDQETELSHIEVPRDTKAELEDMRQDLLNESYGQT